MLLVVSVLCLQYISPTTNSKAGPNLSVVFAAQNLVPKERLLGRINGMDKCGGHKQTRQSETVDTVG